MNIINIKNFSFTGKRKMAASIPSPIALIVIGLLVIAVLGLLAWGLYNFHMVTSRDVNIGRNPYCIREGCTSTGTQIPAYQLSAYNDPQRFAFETVSYCTINAMPCQTVTALNQNCNSFTAAQIAQLASFYNKQYYNNCSYQWGDGVTATPGNNTLGGGSATAADPNSPNLKNGPNDPALLALLTCANTLGVNKSNNSDIAALQTNCNCGPTSTS